MQRIKALVILFIVANYLSSVFGQTQLSGDISKYLFEVSNSPFIVTADIEVPENKQVVINKGCVFFFKEFTGLSVFGNLSVKGTEENPVIFTSIKDTSAGATPGLKASPFDWNGIYIQPSADSVLMSNFMLQYSVYGIKAPSQKIVINNGIFKSNGQYHCSIQDQPQIIEENVPFSYPRAETSAQADTVSTLPVSINKPKTSIKPTKKSILLTSFPSEAEVYFNKQPGRRVWKNGVTPMAIPANKGSGLLVTIFKKGYDNTTYQIDFAKDKNTLHVALLPLAPENIGAQHLYLSDRAKSRTGLGFLLAAPAFLGAGGYALYYTLNQKKDADDAAAFMKKTLLPKSDAEYLRYKDSYNQAKTKTTIGRQWTIAAGSAGAALLVIGAILYW